MLPPGAVASSDGFVVLRGLPDPQTWRCATMFFVGDEASTRLDRTLTDSDGDTVLVRITGTANGAPGPIHVTYSGTGPKVNPALLARLPHLATINPLAGTLLHSHSGAMPPMTAPIRC